jgi:hypothetical protein
MNESVVALSRHDRKLGLMLYRQLKKEVSFEENRFFLDLSHVFPRTKMKRLPQ